MTTLANLRAKLNGEIGVTTDSETTPWSQAVRNTAIGDGYAELWRVGVWKPATQTIATLADTWVYALTSMRQVYRIELLDSSSRIADQVPFSVEDDGSGGYQLVIPSSLGAGYNMTVRGWGPYKSVFTSDSDTDDLPVEYNRVPLLKAKAILWRAQLATFARYASRQAVPPTMNLTVDQFLGMIAAAEREFEVEAKRVASLRPRVMHRANRTLLTA